MAASLPSNKPAGYTCEFIDPVPEDFYCGLCRCVAKEPHLISCCGEHFCRCCITPVFEDGKQCPSCGEAGFNFMLNKKAHQKILALQVHCVMTVRACRWTGMLGQISTHLDVNSGDCQYVDVQCTNCCDQHIQKHQLATHIASECPKQYFICMYCNFKSTYEIVSNEHWPVCQNYPVPCPNRCEVGAVERNFLKDHLKMCSLQVVDCDFSYAGCSVRLQRQDMEKHIEENTQKHMALMAAESVKMCQEFEWELREKEQQIEELQREVVQLRQERIKTVEQKDAEIQLLEMKLQEQIGLLETQSKYQMERIDRLETRYQGTDQLIERLDMKICVPPNSFTMSNFNQRRISKLTWFSPAMYTHPHGYRFHIEVLPNGEFEAYDTHVSVYLYAMQGKFDGILQWPAKCTITLQLLNLYRDQDHITVTKHFEWKKPTCEKRFTGSFGKKFVEHGNLELNVERQTHYLKDDCLCFCVTKIVIK